MTDKIHVGDVLAQALCDTTPRQLYQRAVRAEAAYERAHQQANDALSEAARLKERVAELEKGLKFFRRQYRMTEEVIGGVSFERGDKCVTGVSQATKARRLLDRAEAAVTQHPADNGSLNADTGAHRNCSGNVSDDQPAQGERTRLREQVDQAQTEVATWPEWMTRSYPNPEKPLDPHTLERAARLVLEQGFRTSPSEKAAAIRNLRGDQ